MKKSFFVLFFLAVVTFTHAQSGLSIDAALNNTTAYLKTRLEPRSKLVILNFTSNWEALSDYIIEELTGYIVNDGTFAVVDRKNLEAIRKEMDFQLSGEVSDETAQSIGRKLGAQTIISGSITTIGSSYRFRMRAISVETAQIVGMQNVDVAQDSRLAALTGTAYAGTTSGVTVSPRAASGTAPGGTGNTTVAVPSNSGWQPFGQATVKTGKEKIDGFEKEVVTVDVIIEIKKEAGAEMKDQAIIKSLSEGSGLRFKAIGDGSPWVFAVFIKGVDSGPHAVNVNTQNGKIVEVDVPYSGLRQLNPRGYQGIRTRAFNKSEITSLKIMKNQDWYSHKVGASTIKLFDIEIY